MIRHLDMEAMEEFGTVLPEDTSLVKRPNHHILSLPGKTVQNYRASGPLCLAPGDGAAVLSLSRNGKDFADFYLDRTVCLKGGVWFRLAGLRGSVTVQMCGSSMPLSLGSTADSRVFALEPKIQVQRLYTLFAQQKEEGFVFPGEAHPMAELLYAEAGNVHSVADGQDILLQPGELMLYGPNQWHMQYAAPGQAPRIVSISFDAVGLDWKQLTNRRFSAARETEALLRQMQKCQAQGQGERIFSLLTLLLLSLPEREDVPVPLAQTHENIIIRRAQQYVQAHILEKLTVPAVAGSIGVSPSYLTALFHRHLDIAPADYIRRVKLERSKQMIRQGRMNFTAIAENLQYSTVHHFSRQFKQVYGVTPTEYAKSVRE